MGLLDIIEKNKEENGEETTTQQQKKVESVTITNDHGIKGKLKNGTEFNSYAPSDETLIKTLQDNGVEITAAPPEQPAWWTCNVKIRVLGLDGSVRFSIVSLKS